MLRKRDANRESPRSTIHQRHISLECPSDRESPDVPLTEVCSADKSQKCGTLKEKAKSMGSDTYWTVGFGFLIAHMIFLLYLRFAGK